MGTRTSDPLAQAQSDHTFPFPAASPIFASVLCFLVMFLEPIGDTFFDNLPLEVDFFECSSNGCRKRDGCFECFNPEGGGED